MKEKKNEFIESELWKLTISGAFQRANIYEEKVSEKSKEDFRKLLYCIVKNIAKEYKNPVLESKHIENIESICRIFHESLEDGHLNFGVSQKVLNLYLKYLWCLGQINMPPHFPIDRIIQEKLGIKPIVSWTKELDKEKYLSIIREANMRAKHEKIFIPELELELWRENTCI